MIKSSLFLTGILGLSVTGYAQRVVPCQSNALITYATKADLELKLSDSLLSLQVYYPASFPNESSTKFIHGPLTMKCPTYTVSSSDNKSIRIDGPVEKNLKLITPPFRDGEIDPEVPPRRFVLAFEADYIYPNIQEDYFQQRLSLQMTGGKIRFIYDGDTYFSRFKDLVAGAKINNGPLQPVFFNNKESQISHDGNDKIEIFIKGKAAAFDYVSIDLGKNVIQIKNGIPFPSK